MSDCPSFYPMQSPCSGHGDCVSGLCICHPGWKDTGDYSIVPGRDCDISIDAIRSLAIVSVFVGFVSLLVIGRYLYRRVVIYVKTIFYEEYRIPDLLFPFLLFLGVAILTIIALAKAIDPVRFIVGESLFITVLFCIDCWLGWYGEIIFLRKHFKLMLGFQNIGIMTVESKTRMTELVEAFRVHVTYFYYITVSVSCIPLIGLGYPKNQYIVFGMIFFWIFDATLVAYYTMIVRCVHFIRLELLKNIEAMEQANRIADDYIHDHEQIRTICFFLWILELFYYFILTPFLILLALFGSWEYLMRKADFITLFACIAYQIIWALFILSISYFSPRQLRDANDLTDVENNVNKVAVVSEGDIRGTASGTGSQSSIGSSLRVVVDVLCCTKVVDACACRKNRVGVDESPTA